MAIAWNASQAERVAAVLTENPIDSARCGTAARTIHPIGRERDSASMVWQLWPREGRYVVPRATLRRPWYYHCTVEVESHCVDALTGVPGTSRADYVREHWKEDAIKWVVDDPLQEVP